MRKITKKHFFTVEGETEKWYFDWLQNTINSTKESKYNVKLDCKIQKNPIAYAKGFTLLDKTVVTHVFDRESENPKDTQQFKDTLSNMREAEKVGKQIDYKLGYSNLSFELWIILHKMDCNTSMIECKKYLSALNKAYDEKFKNLSEYKKESNFKRILNKLTISDVIDAVNRADLIMKMNKENGYTLQQFKKYHYYDENPSLSLGDIIGAILKDCRIPINN